MRRLIFVVVFAFFSHLYSYKILFDYTKDETAGNADWVIDRDFPFPQPLNPSSESDWDGGISAFGVAIVNDLHDTVFTLHDYPITYNDSTNPYDLSNFDVFIIPEPQNPFTQREKDAIREFVENGGGLFLISDHNNSDRNHSGWDSPRVLNDLGAENIFGMHFNITGESNNNFTYVSHNITDFAPVTDGSYGRVSALSYHGGTSITLRSDLNPNVKGIVFKNSDNTGCMFAVSSYGKGRVAGIGDSSPLDDGTGDPYDRLYDNWNEEASHKSLFLNTIAWLEKRGNGAVEWNFTLDGVIDSFATQLSRNGEFSMFSACADTLLYLALQFPQEVGGRIYMLFSRDTTRGSVSVPWGRDGDIGSFDFYAVYSKATHSVIFRDSRGIEVDLPITYATSDSVLEVVIPRSIIGGNLFIFGGLFSPLQYRLLYYLPEGENSNGLPRYSYLEVYDSAAYIAPLKPPIISQGFVESEAYTGTNITLSSIIYDNKEVTAARLYYKRSSSGNFVPTTYDSVKDSRYYFTIPPQETPGDIVYYFEAVDNDGNVSRSIYYNLSVIRNPYSVYFENDTLVNKLVEFINGANSSLDICMYEVFNQDVVDALVQAHSRGVRIRVITDSTYYNRDGIFSLINAGIPVIHEGVGQNSTNHIMHNKIVIRDFFDSDTTNDYIWTGSFNASDELHVDNVITIQSHALSNLFEREFNQMWGANTEEPDTQNARTGRRKSDVLSVHGVKLGEDSVYIYFSPQDSAIQNIIRLVNSAHSSIMYLIFSFTRSDLKDALIGAHERGVDIRGVHEDNTRDDDRLNTVFTALKNAGVDVYWAEVPHGYTFLHDKVMIVDSLYVITGSMNWTQSANDDNDENIVIIKSRELAGIYLKKFWEVYNYSRLPHIDTYKHCAALHTFITKTGKLILMPQDLFGKEKINIYDLEGRLVKGCSNRVDILDVIKNLSSGIYIVKSKKHQKPHRIIIVK